MRLPIALAAVFALLTLHAVARAAAAPVRLELYTIGPGDDLFERFGHAALCVVPSEVRADGRAGGTAVRNDTVPNARCYNYGTIDFGSPPEELGYQFLRGDARFWVSVWSLGRMLDVYRAADRSIYRQRLSLDEEAAERAATELAHDARPENREYVYHHLRDNCSTRLRDLLDRATDGALARAGRETLEQSYRDLAAGALAGEPLLVMVGNVAVGRGIDRPVTRFEAAFLPDHLRLLARGALGAEPEIVYRRRGKPLGGEAPHTAGRFAGLALVVAAAYIATCRFGRERLGAAFVGALCGLVGLALWALALVSTVPELQDNEILLLFLPTDVALGFLGARHRRIYVEARLVELAAASALRALGVLMQPLYAVLLIPALAMLAMFFAARARGASGAKGPLRP
ncbi:MAG TPA: DUF4105 domain-containing protein [Polyangiaceae bacterium]